MPLLERIGRGGTSRFNELQRELGASSSTLAETLEELIRVRLVDRREAPGGTPEYVLTSAGRALRQRLRPLLERVRSMDE